MYISNSWQVVFLDRYLHHNSLILIPSALNIPYHVGYKKHLCITGVSVAFEYHTPDINPSELKDFCVMQSGTSTFSLVRKIRPHVNPFAPCININIKVLFTFIKLVIDLDLSIGIAFWKHFEWFELVKK